MKIAVTGTTGFVGTALLPFLRASGHEVMPVRHADQNLALKGADAVIHLGGLAHRIGRETPTADEFEQANHVYTLGLLQSAHEAGVRRFVFVSTINVIAAHAGILSPDLPIKPLSSYGESKARAERAVLDTPQVGPVVLRPPLVYGAGAKANMRGLAKLALTPWPLPFASVNNRRTMVGVTNLVEAIAFALTSAEVEGRIFHVTDAREISLREIVGTIRSSLGRPERMYPVPVWLMRSLLKRAGRTQMADQLFGDLVVDGSALAKAGWTARHDPAKDLAAMAKSLADS